MLRRSRWRGLVDGLQHVEIVPWLDSKDSCAPGVLLGHVGTEARSRQATTESTSIARTTNLCRVTTTAMSITLFPDAFTNIACDIEQYDECSSLALSTCQG